MKQTQIVKIVTDSTSDVPPEIAKELGITVIPLTVQIGNEVFQDGVDLSGADFYRKLVEYPGLPITSQPPLGQIEQVYRELSADGSDVVAIHLSSGLSGTFNTCLMASESEALRPGAVTVIDSQAVTMALGWIAIFAARAAREGQSAAEVADLARSLVPRTRVLALLDTLEWLQRGGRIGKASAFIGTMLAIKPIVSLREGRVVPLERVRTKGRALQRMAELTADFGPLEALCVGHAADPEEAEQLANMLAPIFPRDKMIITHVGPALGTHVGPKAVGVLAIAKA